MTHLFLYYSQVITNNYNSYFSILKTRPNINKTQQNEVLSIATSFSPNRKKVKQYDSMTVLLVIRL